MIQKLRILPLTLLALLVFLSACNRQASTTLTEKNVDKADTLAHSLLWEVSGNGLDEVSYVFGTIHIIDEDKFFWPNNTLSAIDESEQVAFEIDMNMMNDMGSMMSMMDKIYMAGDTTLKDLYTEEEFQVVSNFFSEKGIPLMLLGRIKPLFLSALVGTDIKPGEMSMDGSQSYEMAVQKIANSSDKPIIGLEEIEDQLNMIEQIPNSAQADMLYQTIVEFNKGNNQMSGITDLYLSQNINKMVNSIAEEENMMKYTDILLNDRNNNWIPDIEKLMREKKTFIAVGAGHLAGEEGVIKLLAKRGYTLKPLSIKGDEK